MVACKWHCEVERYRCADCSDCEGASLSEGIIRFVEDKWLGARVGIKLYDALRNGRGEFAGHFNHLPSSSDVVKDYAAYVLKDVVLFILIFALYFLIMHLGVKNLLLEKYAGLSSFEVYAFPFVQLINFFKKKIYILSLDDRLLF